MHSRVCVVHVCARNLRGMHFNIAAFCQRRHDNAIIGVLYSQGRHVTRHWLDRTWTVPWML